MQAQPQTRFDGNLGYLSSEQLRAIAPSVYAKTPHPAVSPRYCFVPTYEVVNELQGHGFRPVAAKQSRARSENGGLFTAHSVRFRHESVFGADRKVGDEFSEVVIVGSHDRSSTLQFSAGVFRLACENGMIVDTGRAESLTFRHLGGYDLSKKIIDAITLSAAASQDAIRRVADWKQIVLPVEKQVVLATRLLEAKGETRFAANRILEANRPEDYAAETGERDLWTTFNVIQEHLVRGGVPYTSPTGRNLRTRPIRSVLGDLSVNKSLWTAVSEFAMSV